MTVASLIRVTGLPSALLWLAWVLAQAMNLRFGVLERHRRDAILHRAGIGAQHVQARAIGHDLDGDRSRLCPCSSR